MNETYQIKQIPDWPGYWADTNGGIWSAWTRGGKNTGKPFRKLQPGRTSTGRLTVSPIVNGVQRTCQVHRLILETFVGPCPPGMESCHFPDRDPTNNRPENLRWDTKSANSFDAVKHGTAPGLQCKGEKNGNAKLNELQVRVIRRLRGQMTRSEAAAIFKITRSHVGHIQRGDCWKHLLIYNSITGECVCCGYFNNNASPIKDAHHCPCTATIRECCSKCEIHCTCSRFEES